MTTPAAPRCCCELWALAAGPDPTARSTFICWKPPSSAPRPAFQTGQQGSSVGKGDKALQLRVPGAQPCTGVLGPCPSRRRSSDKSRVKVPTETLSVLLRAGKSHQDDPDGGREQAVGKCGFRGGPLVSLWPDPVLASSLPSRRRSATPSCCWRSWRPRLLPAVPLAPAGPGAAAERRAMPPCRWVPAGPRPTRRVVFAGEKIEINGRDETLWGWSLRGAVFLSLGVNTAGLAGQAVLRWGRAAPCRSPRSLWGTRRGMFSAGRELRVPSCGISQHPAPCTSTYQSSSALSPPKPPARAPHPVAFSETVPQAEGSPTACPRRGISSPFPRAALLRFIFPPASI